MPRPGQRLQLELAPTQRIAHHAELAADFFERILELNYDECLVTDESSLWDFHTEESNAPLHEQIWLASGVDVSDIASGNLVLIFERLRVQGVSAS